MKELFTIGRIEKVSYEVYKECMKRYYPTYDFDLNEECKLLKDYNNIKMPKRLDHNQPGYNFKAPFNFSLYPGTHIYIPTGIAVSTDTNWMTLVSTDNGIQISAIIEPLELTGESGDEITTTNSEIASDTVISRGHVVLHLLLPDNKPAIFLSSMTMFNKDLRFLYEARGYKAGDVFATMIFMPYGIVENDIPESDNVHLVLKPISNFVWSAISYPGSTDPKLDGKTVVVTIDTDGYTVTYNFEEVPDIVEPEEPDVEENPDEEIPDVTDPDTSDEEVVDPEIPSEDESPDENVTPDETPDVTDPVEPEDTTGNDETITEELENEGN